MRCLIWSDLHVDVNAKQPFVIPDKLPPHDVKIIAGDICEHPDRGVAWIVAGNLNDTPVIVVAGNHEFYHDHIVRGREKGLAEAAKHKNIHILQDSHVDIDGVRFIGATLWTDYLLYGEAYQWQCYTAAQNGMSDHHLIRTGREFRKFSTEDAYLEHCASRDYIEGMLKESFVGTKVVVTHHPPSGKSLDHERHSGDILNGAFASNLDHLVDQADLWVHGHVHKPSDYRIGRGRVVSNPRGYVRFGESDGFIPDLVIDVTADDRLNSEDYSAAVAE